MCEQTVQRTGVAEKAVAGAAGADHVGDDGARVEADSDPHLAEKKPVNEPSHWLKGGWGWGVDVELIKRFKAVRPTCGQSWAKSSGWNRESNQLTQSSGGNNGSDREASPFS